MTSCWLNLRNITKKSAALKFQFVFYLLLVGGRQHAARNLSPSFQSLLGVWTALRLDTQLGIIMSFPKLSYFLSQSTLQGSKFVPWTYAE